MKSPSVCLTCVVCVSALLLTLAGCGGGGHGGGGGGNTGAADLASAPGQAAWTTFIQSSQQGTLSATDSSGNNYSMQLSLTPNQGTTTFDGQANAYSSVLTLTATKNGTAFYSYSYTGYYLLNPSWQPLGAVWTGGTPYAVVTTFEPLPTTLMPGDAGAVYNMTYYYDSTESTTDASLAVTYTVSAHNANNLNFCLIFDVTGVTAQGTTDGVVPGEETDCYRVDAAGMVSLYEVVLFNGNTGLTLTFE